jgi:hypothetical protein
MDLEDCRPAHSGMAHYRQLPLTFLVYIGLIFLIQIAIGWTLYVHSPCKIKRILSIAKTSRLALGPTERPAQLVPWILFPGTMRPHFQ